LPITVVPVAKGIKERVEDTVEGAAILEGTVKREGEMGATGETLEEVKDHIAKGSLEAHWRMADTAGAEREYTAGFSSSIMLAECGWQFCNSKVHNNTAVILQN
jgi:hypothetical protein